MPRDNRLTVGEIWAHFAQTTTISGLLFIHKAKNGVLKLGAFMVFAVLVTMTVIACYGAVETFFERPTKVVKTMRHGALNFPAVTFCATNPFKASEVKKRSLEIYNMIEELKSMLYNSYQSSFATQNEARGRRKRDVSQHRQPCPSGYFMVAGGCYIITNLQTTWQAANDACQSLGARLPIFSNFSDYLSFFLWLNQTSPDTELWIGLYSSANLNWTWIDNCPYQGFYPGFWAADLPLIQIDAMYGRLTKRGVAWSHGMEVRDVICYKAAFDEKLTCETAEFLQKPNAPSILCYNPQTGLESWWCAADHPEWSKVESAAKSDSCFCLFYSSQQVELTIDEADSACQDRNGTLADFRSDQEVAMIEHLIASFNRSDADLKNACPFESTYANRSCFMFLAQLSASIQEADQNCRNSYPGGRLMSLHSTYEHNAALREYSIKSKNNFVNYFGVYTGLHRDQLTDWKWTDGSPLDYWPTWSVWRIPNQPQTDPNAFFICLNRVCPLVMRLMSLYVIYNTVLPTWLFRLGDGLIHDYLNILTKAMCRKNLRIYPLWTSLSSHFDEKIGSKQTFWSNTNSTDVPRNLILDESETASTADTNYMLSSGTILAATKNQKAIGALCRRDRASNAASHLSKKPVAKETFMKQEESYQTAMPRADMLHDSNEKNAAVRNFADGYSEILTNSDARSGTKIDTIVQLAKGQQKLYYMIERMDSDFLASLSYNLSDLLLHAAFDGIKLNSRDFVTKYYPGTGNCFTFNSVEPLRRTGKAGDDRGLEIVLKISILEYLFLSVSPGFLFLIHSPNETIYPESQALKVSSGFSSDIVLKYSEQHLQSWPYSDCLINPPENYSTDGCYRTCEQMAVFTHCSCCDPSLPLLDNTTYCKYDMEPCIEAVKTFGNFSPSDYLCDCPQPCSKLEMWSNEILESLIYILSISNTFRIKYIAKVKVFFRTLTYSVQERVSAYKLAMLISDIAQFLGLWLGFSALTLFEIIELICSLCAKK